MFFCMDCIPSDALFCIKYRKCKRAIRIMTWEVENRGQTFGGHLGTHINFHIMGSIHELKVLMPCISVSAICGLFGI